jgi:DNA-binding LacI/PurR family transcriptional regulator
MKNGVREVAQLAKVSIGTVSNVLNRPELVSPATVERVHAAMSELGYQVGATKRGRRILAFGESSHGKAIIEKVAKSGLEVQAIDLSDESKREKLLRYLLNNKSAAAAILIVTQAGQVASDLSDLLNQGNILN